MKHDLIDLESEVAVVIGGTGVLGGAMAEAVAAHGARVAILGRNEDRGGQRVDDIARTIIEENGFKGKFGHGLGHGAGLAIHEYPRVSPRYEEPLAAGMVFTVEPGIYIPGWGGIRIEDDVLVTEDGIKVLTSLPK